MQVSRRRPMAVAALALCFGGLLPASQATASIAPSTGTTSVDRAGYDVVADGLRQVAGSWTQPSGRCTSTTTFADFRVGLSRGRKTLQAGTAVDCHGGHARYYAWVRIPGMRRQVLDEVVEPGDELMAKAVAVKGELRLSITDYTQGWGDGMGTTGRKIAFTSAAAGVAARSDVDKVLPLTDFDVVQFSSCRVDKERLVGQDAERVIMQRSTGIVQAKPSELAPPGDFSVRWRHR
jgi:hypothetical protein